MNLNMVASGAPNGERESEQHSVDSSLPKAISEFKLFLGRRRQLLNLGLPSTFALPQGFLLLSLFYCHDHDESDGHQFINIKWRSDTRMRL